jgi:hypothetical protein
MDLKVNTIVTGISIGLSLANGYQISHTIKTADLQFPQKAFKSSACTAINGHPVANLCNVFSDARSGEPFLVALVSSTYQGFTLIPPLPTRTRD